MKKCMWLFSGLSALLVFSTVWADVIPGETITKDNLAQAETLLTPSTRWMVERGMPMTILETEKVEWPKAYKEATDKYSGQVRLSKDGAQLHNYIAGARPSLTLTSMIHRQAIRSSGTWNRTPSSSITRGQVLSTS